MRPQVNTNKPKFNPNQGFEVVDDTKPKFDPSIPFEAIEEKKAPSKLESAMRGYAQGGTFGLADELTAGIGAAKDVLTRKDYSPLSASDWRDAYKGWVGAIRRADKEAKEANPMTYGAAEIGSGIATSFIPGARVLNPSAGASAAKMVGTGAAGGGLAGFGYSEADNLGDLAIDTAIGAGIGGAAGAVLPAGKYAIKKGGEAVDAIGDLSKSFSGAFKRSAETNTAHIPLFGKYVAAAKEALETSKDRGTFRKLIERQKEIIRNTMVSNIDTPGGANADNTLKAARALADKMSDDDVINYGLLHGNDEVVDWVSSNAASQGRGFNAQEIAEQLKINPTERARLRDFNITDKARELQPVVEETSKALDKQRSIRWNQLQDEAKDQFNQYVSKKDFKGIIDTFDDGLLNAKDLGEGQAFKAIAKAKEIIRDGSDAKMLGLKKMPYHKIGGSESFMRLQKAREFLDASIQMPQGKATNSDRILLEQRKIIDRALKSVDAKSQADEIYKRAKKIEEMVFDKTELRGGVDPYKIKRLMGNSDEALRFQDGLEQLREFAKTTDDKLSADVANNMLGKVDDVLKDYGMHQKITGMKFKQGGQSSQAIERLGGRLKGDDLTTQAIQNPVGFMQSQDEMVKMFTKELGKPFDKMTQDEKMGLVRLMTWYKNQPQGATPESIRHNFKIFTGRK